MKKTYDYVIRRGSIADGTGGPLFEADIAVKNGQIVAIGPDLQGSGHEEFNAAGKLVTPGFVDIHTHYDGQAIWDSRLESSSWHGVTTVVTGNCGVGFAPVKHTDHQRLIELMEGVEDIPGTALHEGLDWCWESFPEYLDAIERKRHDVDICAQVPHGALRVYVMGERALRLEPATGADIARMRELVGQAVRAGAVGVSTSRSINHKSSTGASTPSLRATEDELLGLALGLQDAGTGVFSLLTDFDVPDLQTEFATLRRVASTANRPLSFSLLQKHTEEHSRDWRTLLALTAEAVAAGVQMKAQVAPRPLGTLLGLQASRTPFSSCPTFKEISQQPLDTQLRLLRDPSVRDRILAEAGQLHQNPTGVYIPDYHHIFPLGNPVDYDPGADQALEAMATRQGRTAAALAYDMLQENNGRRFLYAPLANYYDCTLDVCGEMLRDPNTLIGLGDGGAHVGLICDASFPTYLLAHWGRDRTEDTLNIPWLVKRLTQDNAQAIGLTDRGVLGLGKKADVNVIDLDALALEQPRMHFDLPAGGKRLLQRAQGFDLTLVSGVLTQYGGVATEALPGRLVRQYG